jgi:hypothetical protein
VFLAKLPGRETPHTLRHTAATWLMHRGVPIWEAAGLLGMSPEVLQDTYGHHDPDYLKGAAAAIGQKGRHVFVVDLTEGQNQTKKPNDFLVGVAGFEPATPASRTQCSTGLSHTPTRRRLIALGFAHRKNLNEGSRSR